MKPRYLLVASAAIAAVVGIVFILFQGPAMGLVGAMGAGWVAQALGAATIGFAVLNFFSRNLEDGEGLRVVLLANFVSSLLDLLITVISGLTGGLPIQGWIFAVLFLLFALGFGYFLFFTPSGRLASARR